MNKLINFIIWSVFSILSIILIIQLLLKISGHSPTEFQVIYMWLGIITAFLLGAAYKVGIFIGRANNFMKQTKQFMKYSQKKFEKIEKDLSTLTSN